MIDQLTVQKIIDAANIVEVVSDFVNLRKRGVNYVGLCPFHSDRNPSFYVSASKNICKCFSCGEGGTPVHFIMKHEQLDYVGALKYLAHKYNITVEEREQTDEEKKQANDRESLFIVNQYAKEYFENTLTQTIEGQTIGGAYFKERGLRPETIKQFGLGYSTESKSALTDLALSKGYQPKYLVDSGLSIKSDDDNRPPIDRFRGRVIFPVFNLSGKVVAFGGRILAKKDKVAKYVNSPENLVYSKSRELYGLYQAKRAIMKEDKCFMVEGYMDVLSMHQIGIENVVSSSGTALTVQQIRLLHRFTDNITVLYDGDAAGIKAALRGIDLLLEEGMHIKVVLLPDGEDPDSYAQSHSAQEFADFIQRSEVDFIQFKTQLLLADSANDPIKRASVITDIVQSISLIPATIERAVYIQSTSQLLNIDESILLAEVKKRRNKPTYYNQANSNNSANASNQTGADQDATTSSNRAQESAATDIQSNSAIALETLPSAALASYEVELTRYIIRNGNERILVEVSDNTPEEIAISQFIREELDEGDISLGSPLFQKILDEAVNICLREDINTEKYFTNHPIPEISKIAVDMVTERYQLSKVYERYDNVSQYPQELNQQDALLKGQKILREIYNIKNAYVLELIKETQNKIIEAQHKGDNGAILNLMAQLTQLNELKSSFALALGDRTII